MGKIKAAANPQSAIVVKGVSLSAVDWALLDALGIELRASGSGRATTSAAIRHLVAEECRRPGRVKGEHALFIVGADADGRPVKLLVDLRTGRALYHMPARPGLVKTEAGLLVLRAEDEVVDPPHTRRLGPSARSARTLTPKRKRRR